jgi:glycosyltransferase involved in cell wall biosynthesis
MNGLPTILAVHHGWGGGVERHIELLAELFADRVNYLLMFPGGEGAINVCLAQKTCKASTQFAPITQRGDLLQFLRNCNVRRVHIHHFFGNEYYLESLLNELKLPFDFTVHDYHVLSPQPHLVGREGRFIGDDLRVFTQCELVTFGIAPARPSSLAEWRGMTRWLLAEANRVIVPSHDVLRRLERFFPELRAVVAAHPESRRRSSAPICVAPAPADLPLRITLLGTIAPHKGAQVLAACAHMSKSERLPLEFQVIGDVVDAARLRELGVKISGSYVNSDLPRLLQEFNPHLIWFPAQCPETFSYTLSEGLSANLPLVVANIGALPERVGGRPWTWIENWNNTPSEWIKFFLTIREQNFLQGAPPKPTGRPWDVTDEFYHQDYFDWIVSDAPPHHKSF